MFKQNLLLLALGLSLIQCTSIQFSHYDQAIRVTTLEPGAEIWQDKELLGVTPALVHVRRGVRPKIELNYPNGKRHKFTIETNYRWLESPLPSLIIPQLSLGLIATDFLTGTAWELKNLDEVRITGKAPGKKKLKPMVLAVAPSRQGHNLLIDEVGKFLERKMNERKSGQVLPYNSTFGVFDDYQYTRNFDLSSRQRVQLFADLKITHVLESQIVVDEARSFGQIKYKIREVVFDQVIEEGILDIPPDLLAEVSERRNKFKEFFTDMVPNTMSVNFAKHNIMVKQNDDLEFSANPNAATGWLGETSKFLGTFGISNLLPPGGQRAFEAHLRFITAFDFAYNEFEFDNNLHFFNRTSYKMARGLGAIGPQVYLETLLGNFYTNFLAGSGYTQLSWNSPISNSSLGRLTFHTVVELGFYRYLSNRLAWRLFIRSVSEDRRTWNWAFTQANGIETPIEEVSSVMAGMALGFYFPEVRRWLR